jgi:hypothetical protein
MASLDTGRLSAILKILDQATTQLTLAVREHAPSWTGYNEQPPAQDDATAAGIVSLLGISEHAAAHTRSALTHIRDGNIQHALSELESAGTFPRPEVFSQADMLTPWPAKVLTALRLMRGISGFFASETEQILVRELRTVRPARPRQPVVAARAVAAGTT